jgi:hypothetical protein
MRMRPAGSSVGRRVTVTSQRLPAAGNPFAVAVRSVSMARADYCIAQRA